MPATPDEFLALLSALGIPHRTEHHEALFTVVQSREVKQRIPGAHSKNLFVKDKKSRFFLVTAKDDTEIDLKRLHEVIGASGRLSFGSAEQLREVLGVEPGSVAPFAVMNDSSHRVVLVLDERLMAHETLNFHPLLNTMTTSVPREGLLAFLRHTGHAPRILALPAPAEAEV